jgi:hypothetical protein
MNDVPDYSGIRGSEPAEMLRIALVSASTHSGYRPENPCAIRV